MAREISGTAVAVTVGGFVLLYSAIKDATISTTLHSFLAGAPVVSVAPINSANGGPLNRHAVSSFGSGPPTGGQSGSQYTYLVGQLQMQFNNAGCAAILGNMDIESKFSPTAYNPGEGAIGFCQWEHGRRLALQAYARAHGSSETDPAMQFGYMMQELHTAFAPVYLQMKALPNTARGATYGAAIWDAQYEISSGDARAARQSSALSIFHSLSGG